MKDKQLTLKEILKKIINAECISCGEDINKEISYRWRIPLCKKCRIEAIQDLNEDRKE